MRYSNRLDALESTARKRPTKCSSCGRGVKNTPGVVVLERGQELGQCPACRGPVSPDGEPVLQIVDGEADVTIILLVPGPKTIPELPGC